jgi:type VI secretion system protein ImpM
LIPESVAAHDACAAGWYGKMPCLADFASRRLGAGFIGTWDTWLQRAIAVSRETLRERWLEVFLRSPMWRFVLGPGVCGDEGWTGLLVPSVDKVGRYFPLTFALPLRRSPFDLSDLIAQQAWYAELERIALSALSIECTIEALEEALAKNPFPRARSRFAGAGASELAEWLQNTAAPPLRREFSNAEFFAADLKRSAEILLAARVNGRGFWWSVKDQSGAIDLHCTPGLPDPAYYAVLLDSVAPDVEGLHQTATAE